MDITVDHMQLYAIHSYVHVRVLLYIVLCNSSVCINHCIVAAYASVYYKTCEVKNK